jgi:hypothetical protein
MVEKVCKCNQTLFLLCLKIYKHRRIKNEFLIFVFYETMLKILVMRKINIFILSIIFLPMIAWSQVTAQEPLDLNLGSEGNTRNGLFSSPHFGVQFGSAVSTGFGNGPLFTQSIAPHLKFHNNQNFTLTLGSTISTSNLGAVSQFNSPMMPQRFMSTAIFALGAYELNPRLTLTGGTWVERNNLSYMQDQMNPQAFNLNAGGMMMGLDYRISENFSVGAEINVSRGQSPFNMYQHNPGSLHSNPFKRNYPW